MSSVIQNILQNSIGSGARQTKFECMIYFNSPDFFSKSTDIYSMIKTSQFPGKSHDVIDMKFKGRNIPIKGQVKYDNTWSCTFYMTEDHALKIAFEDWIESLDQHNMKEVSSRVQRAQIDNLNTYTSTMFIAQNDFHGEEQTALYELHQCFPKSVTAVDMDYSGVGTITEFTVEFSYAYYNAYNIQNSSVSEIEFDSKSNIITNIASRMNSIIQSALNDVDAAITNVASSAINNALDTISFGGSALLNMSSSYDE